MSRGLSGALAGMCVLLSALLTSARAQESPAAAEGTIAGKVIDKSTADPIIEAGVEVIGVGKKVRTDLDGKYSIKVPAGTYQVRIFAPLYQSVRLEEVRVVAGQTAKADAALAPEGKAAVEVVEVVAKADKQAEAIQLLERKNSAVVSDNIGAQTIKESPDSNAAEVVERVPAVTIRDGKYVYVRGLGPRYTSALLNGSKMPSTDPNKRVIPLDLFPSDFIESIQISKSYTPDLPGDSPGGFVDIRLREPPERLSYTLGMTTSADTATTFSSFQTYSGTYGDLFALGKGSRSLPTIIPDRDINSCPACPADNNQTPASQQRAYAGAFKDVWTPHSITAPPNFQFNGNIGDTFGPFGISLSGIWGVDYQTHPDQIANEFTSGGAETPLFPTQLFTYRTSTQTARLGGVLTSSYTIDSNNRINFRAFDNHVGQDNVLDGSGFDFNANTTPPTLAQTTLYYQEQNLGYGQLEGEHHFDLLTINWRSALSQTTLDAPDARFLTRNAFGGFYPNSDSALRTFLDVSEYLTDSAVDFTVPFKTGLPGTDVWSGLPAKFKFGPAYTYRNRNLTYRRFRFQFANDAGVDTTAPGETFLIPENVGQTPGDTREFNFVEDTRPSDQFDANQEIAAIYGLIDTPIIPDQLRLIAGVRVEYSYIAVNGADLQEGKGIHTRLNDLNPLPGVNLVYSPRPDMNVRFGYSITVSRPEFRELTPTEFVEPLGFRTTIGNPFLVQSTVNAYDLRWEWFLSPLELLSFGGFYKGLDKPIEQTVLAQSSSVADSWLNANSATLYGFEFEARKNFDQLTDPAREYLSDGVANQIRNFSLLTNVAYVYSNVKTSADTPCVPGTPQCADLQAQSNRALQGQAPYAVNATLEYNLPEVFTARLLYNISGSYIQAVGTKVGNSQLPPLPSIEQQPRNELDFVITGVIKPFDVPLNAKFAVENILNAAYFQTQGPELTSRYRNGVQFGFSISYTY